MSRDIIVDISVEHVKTQVCRWKSKITYKMALPRAFISECWLCTILRCYEPRTLRINIDDAPGRARALVLAIGFIVIRADFVYTSTDRRQDSTDALLRS